MELRGSGISVVMIEPGVISTPLWDKTISAEDELIRELPDYGRQMYGASLLQRREMI